MEDVKGGPKDPMLQEQQQHDENKGDERGEPHINGLALSTLEGEARAVSTESAGSRAQHSCVSCYTGLLVVLGQMYSERMKFLAGYRVALRKFAA